MAKKINEECKIVQEILINEKSGGLLSSEESRISKHVYACQLCWEFQERLIYLSDAMRVDEKSHLEPRKTTRHVLISRFRQRHRKPGFQYLKVMDKIKRLFTYRIPLYQAMLATAVVTFFGVDSHWL